MTDTPRYVLAACANCESPEVTLRTPLFCSSQCRQAAELVRYVRGCRRDGRAQLPDIQEAIHLRMAMVLGGGYPERERRVSPQVRAAVFERAEGHCESCGRGLDLNRSAGDSDAFATIQHVAGNSNDLSNLKAFCGRCNTSDAQSRFVPVNPDSAEAALAVDLEHRWSSKEPIRLCDDDIHWTTSWQQLARTAKEAIRQR